MKGGAGKSTVAVNVARGLQLLDASGDAETGDAETGDAESGAVRDVVLIDYDPQGTALRWGSSSIDSGPFSGVEGPATSRVSPPLSRALRPHLTAPGRIVVVDGVAKSKDRTAEAVRLSDVVLIPVRPSGPDVHASGPLVKAVRARREQEPGFRAAFVVSQAIVGTRLSSEVAEDLSAYGLSVLDAVLHMRVEYQYAIAEGLSVLDRAPDSKAAAEVRGLTRETLGLIRSGRSARANASA
jgi:chromosome partitioning protein